MPDRRRDLPGPKVVEGRQQLHNAEQLVGVDHSLEEQQRGAVGVAQGQGCGLGELEALGLEADRVDPPGHLLPGDPDRARQRAGRDGEAMFADRDGATGAADRLGGARVRLRRAREQVEILQREQRRRRRGSRGLAGAEAIVGGRAGAWHRERGREGEGNETAGPLRHPLLPVEVIAVRRYRGQEGRRPRAETLRGSRAMVTTGVGAMPVPY